MESDSTGQPAAADAAVSAPADAPASQPAETAASTAPSSSRDDFAAGFGALPQEPDEPEASETKADAPKAEKPEATPEPVAEPKPSEPVLTREQIIAEYRAEQDKKAADEANAARAKAAADAEHEKVFGKPNELADLLAKRVAWNRGDPDAEVFTNEDDARIDKLTESALAYQPYRQQALTEAEQKIADARAEGQQVADSVLTTIGGAYQSLIGKPGIDAAVINGEPDPRAVVAHVYGAGAASRQPEIDELKGEKEHLVSQLAEARGMAFRSQPPVEAAGGVSPGGGRSQGLSPDASSGDEFRHAFSSAGGSGQNGRR